MRTLSGLLVGLGGGLALGSHLIQFSSGNVEMILGIGLGIAFLGAALAALVFIESKRPRRV